MDLDDYLPYLVNRLGQRFVADFTPSLTAAGVDVQMWRVMSVLYAKGDQSAGALSALTSINLSTLSRLVGRMVGRDLIRRERRGQDARSVVIALTDEGRRCTESLIPDAVALEKRAAGHLTKQELASLKALLNKLYRGISVDG